MATNNALNNSSAPFTVTAGSFSVSNGTGSVNNDGTTGTPVGVIGLNQTSNDVNGGVIQITKQHGTGNPIQSGDTVGNYAFYGFDGTNYVQPATIDCITSGTVAANRVAGTLRFYTHPDSTSGGLGATVRMTIAPTGAVTINSPDSGTTLTAPGSIAISSDSTASTVSIGAGAGVKTVTLGSSNTTSITSIQSGSSGISAVTSNSGNINLAAGSGGATSQIQMIGANGNLDIASGTGQITIANDATTSSVLVGAGAGVKTVTIGSSNTTSATIINSGSGAITLIGVFGVTTGVTGVPVVIDNTGKIGTVVSSIKFKENINKIGSISNDIYNLNPVSFNYKKDSTKSIYYGLIAEEVNEVMPQLVVHDDQGEINTVRYDQLVPLLLNEVQQLRKELNELKG